MDGVSNLSGIVAPDRAAWIGGQKAAFQAAMDGAPLATSLGILIKTAIEQAETERRCAFYIADPTGTTLHHVIGMPESYARAIDGFKIGPDSLACGLAIAIGQPVITLDVAEEPLWQPWLTVAREHGFRCCWSFPVETSTGKIVGTLAMYFAQPQEPSQRDLEIVQDLTHAASIIISRHQVTEERTRVRDELVRSQHDLATELAATQQLQSVSLEIARERDAGALYEKILDAAVAIMGSDFASLQMLYPERGQSGEMRLLGHRGFTPEAAEFWEWVAHESEATCSVALGRGERIITEDITNCDYLTRGGVDEKMFLDTGIRAVQSTPLISRDGKRLGMISTHWRKPHRPSERDLRLFDILARQAADVIERKEAEERTFLLVRELEHRSNNLLAAVTAIVRMTKAASHEDYVRSLLGRIGALARVNKLLGQNRWGGMDIAQLIAHELLPYGIGETGRIRLQGPPQSVRGKVAQSLALVLHELATNAAKYGALSQPAGTVVIDWVALPSAGLKIRWCESGGPTVVPPNRRGFGSNLVDAVVVSDFQGDLSMNWLSTGLVCEFTVSLEALSPLAPKAMGEISH